MQSLQRYPVGVNIAVSGVIGVPQRLHRRVISLSDSMGSFAKGLLLIFLYSCQGVVFHINSQVAVEITPILEAHHL